MTIQAEEVKRLFDLFQQGVLTESEFAEAKEVVFRGVEDAESISQKPSVSEKSKIAESLSAVKNVVSDVSGKAVAFASSEKTPKASKDVMTMKSNLAVIHDLFQQGILNEEEYNEQKAAILQKESKTSGFQTESVTATNNTGESESVYEPMIEPYIVFPAPVRETHRAVQAPINGISGSRMSNFEMPNEQPTTTNLSPNTSDAIETDCIISPPAISVKPQCNPATAPLANESQSVPTGNVVKIESVAGNDIENKQLQEPQIIERGDLPMNEYAGKICPYCKTEIRNEDEVTVCPACGIPHHQACWIENKGCTTFGCNEQHYEPQGTNISDDCSNCGAPLGDGQAFCPKCGTPKAATRPNICGKCGAELSDGLDFCPKCGQKVGLVVESSVSAKINQFNAAVNTAKKKNIGIIAGVAIAVIVILAVALGGSGGANFKKIYEDLDEPYYISVASDGSSLSIDTNPLDEDDYTVSGSVQDIKAVNKALGLPDSLWDLMGGTNSLDGRQTETYGKITVSWKFHPDNGVEVIYRKN